MSAPQHPIRKMQKELYGVRNVPPRVQRVIARHVKPLLDKIDMDHDQDAHEGPGPGGEEDFTFERPEWCEACRILAEWRRPL